MLRGSRDGISELVVIVGRRKTQKLGRGRSWLWIVPFRKNAIFGIREVVCVTFDPKERSTAPDSGDTCRSTSHGRIKDRVTGIGVMLNHPFQQAFGLLRWMKRLVRVRVKLNRAGEVFHRLIWGPKLFGVAHSHRPRLRTTVNPHAVRHCTNRVVSHTVRRPACTLHRSLGKHQDVFVVHHRTVARVNELRSAGLVPDHVILEQIARRIDHIDGEQTGAGRHHRPERRQDAAELGPDRVHVDDVVPLAPRGPIRKVGANQVEGCVGQRAQDVKAFTPHEFEEGGAGVDAGRDVGQGGFHFSLPGRWRNPNTVAGLPTACALRLGVRSPTVHRIELAVRQLGGLSTRKGAARAWALGLVPVLTPIFEGHWGRSYEGTARILNEEGVPARRGGKWSRTQVMRLIHIGSDHGVMPRAIDIAGFDLDRFEWQHGTTEAEWRGKTVDLDTLYKSAVAQFEQDARKAKLIEVEVQTALRWRAGKPIRPLDNYQSKADEDAMKAEWITRLPHWER